MTESGRPFKDKVIGIQVVEMISCLGDLYPKMSNDLSVLKFTLYM